MLKKHLPKDIKGIEEKWQKYWDDSKLFTCKEDSEKEKFYSLVMFPYPSGSLHIGHVRNYSIGDVFAWYKRLCGFNVIHPIGWDSFGQPAERAAIKNNVQPKDWTEKNIEHMRGQIKRLGISYDWSKEVTTHKAEYYVWNQWFFLQMFKKGLVYQKFSPVNWCPNEQTVLSNEQASGGKCWRCETEVTQKELNQWFIKTTNYAEELLKDLETLAAQGWPDNVLKMQRNWIGQNETIDSLGKKVITYNFHDWGISRQRFWGTPIPLIHCLDCGVVAVKEEDLPILLPEKADFSSIGDSPLAKIEEFVNTTCPNCGKDAKRETDTMDTFVDSSWYYFRYSDPKNSLAPFDKEKIKKYLPVDLYIGGVEHAVMHLLYTRFWTKMMRDIGLISFDEPIKKLITQGMVMNLTQYSCFGSPVWLPMSKSLGNGVDPDTISEKYGADALRMFVLFAAPTEDELRWSEKGISGIVKFMSRIYKIVEAFSAQVTTSPKACDKEDFTEEALKIIDWTNQVIVNVTRDIEKFHFNTCISAMMEFVNKIEKSKLNFSTMEATEIFAFQRALKSFALLLAPFAPHFAEEIWQILGHPKSILQSDVSWPTPVNTLTQKKSAIIPVQIDGKFCTRIEVSYDATEEEIKSLVLVNEKVKSKITSEQIAKIIIVAKQIINIVSH